MSSFDPDFQKSEGRSLDLCPDCGYSFNGLPAEGRCPECGLAFGRDHIVLYGFEANVEQIDYWRKIVAGLMLTAWTVVFGWVVLISCFILFTIALVANFLWERSVRQHAKKIGRAPVQLRLFPESYSFRQGVGRVGLRPWKHVIRMTLTPLGNGQYRIMIRNWPSVGGQGIGADVELNPDLLERIQMLGKSKIGKGFQMIDSSSR